MAVRKFSHEALIKERASVSTGEARKDPAREPGDPKTAKQNRLTIPPFVLYRADEATKWPVAFRW